MPNATRTTRNITAFLFTLLVIEFLDEFVFGAREAAWPLIRDDLGLNYTQIGLLLGLPSVVGNLIEPILGILSDVWQRRALILGGGVFFTASLLLTALSQEFVILLLAFMLFYPASGAFVSLSQATLMDVDPTRREHNMARWTLAGSLGVVAGPIALGVGAALGLDWRSLFLVFAGLAAVVLAVAWRLPLDFRFKISDFRLSEAANRKPTIQKFRAGIVNALGALRRGAVLRWLVLLEFSDMMLDILLGFLALYMVDVAGATPFQAGVAVAVWTGVGLLGDLLLIPLLERVPGLRYLRFSIIAEMALYPAFLLMPNFWVKLALLGLLGLFNSGWYSILQAQLYSAMPGQSGAALAVKNVSGLVGGLVPLGLGLVAERFNLGLAMWLLLLGPIALLIGVPTRITTSDVNG